MGKLAEYEAKRDEVVASAQEILARLDGESPEGEDAEKLRSLNAEFETVVKQIEESQEFTDIAARMQTQSRDDAKTRGESRPPIYGAPSQEVINQIVSAMETPGDAFLRSEQYTEWMKRFPQGGPGEGISGHSGAVEVGQLRDLIGLRTATEKLRGELTPVKLRDLLTSDPGSAGALVQSLRRGLIEPGLVRPLTVRDLVTVIPVGTDTIEWVKESARDNNAAIVAEASALTGSSGTKPQGRLVYELVTDTIKTIAEWIPASKRIVADASGLRGLIDSYLTYDLALELEDQMVSGAGGSEFDGILSVTGTDTQTGADNMLDDLRFAKRKVASNGRTVANGVLINPEDAATIDTIKAGAATPGDGGGSYYGQSPFNFTGNSRVWGMPLVESEAVSPGTAVVGDFRRAVLYDRESTNISIGTADDDFIRNIVRVLAELRAGFAVVRPSAFVIVTF